MKNRLKPCNDKAPTPICRSRSIDSVSGNEQTQPTGGVESTDEKPQNTETLANKFRKLRKRLSRTSNCNKHEQAINRVKLNHNEKENTGKSGGDDSEASSVGEDFTQLSFTEVPTTNTELTDTESSIAIGLKVIRSLPLEKTPSIVTSPPNTDEKTDDSGSSNENANLSKTWSSSAFTGAQLRGTCSLEYTEHMKDKSHKKKAHMVDLRKDDGQQQSTTTTITSTSKNTISTSFTSYHTHAITVVNNKGALF